MNVELIAQTLGFDVEDVSMLLDMFVDNANESLEMLDTAINKSDFDTIKNAAHAIKGSASNLLLSEITTIAGEIEIAAKEKKAIDYHTKYSALKNEILSIEVDKAAV